MRWIAVGAGALLAIALVTTLALWWYASAKLDEIDIPALTENRTDPDAPQDVIEGTMNVLVVGNASREGLTEEQLLELGTEDDGSALTDTIMLVQISPVRDEAVVVSFPRDLRVDPPGEVGVVKINSVQTRGGPDLLVRTIQDLTGLPIDHYVEIDMAGFLHLANALGGVEVLDAGFLSSALLVGAAVGFAAENERDYGVGDVARGLGKMGWKAFEAARKAPDAAAEASEATMEAASSFDDKISRIRKDLEADKRRAAAEAPKFAAEE